MKVSGIIDNDVKKQGTAVELWGRKFRIDNLKALAENFYGIKEVVSFKAMNLDIEGADVEAILSETIKEIENSNI